MNKKQTYLLWLIFAVSLFFSVGASAQTVTKTFKNESLKTVLKEVERQTKMSVIYNVDEVDTNRKITASFKQTPVREVLTRVLGTGNSFDIQNKMITIRKRLEGQESSVQPRSTQGVTRKISGKVVDTTGEPLIGVSVKVRNSGIAVVTNVDGEYAITTNESNPTLEFSYIGFAPQTLLAGGRSVLNVTLREEENKLQEVVVTAMGIQRKESSLTYATQRVKAEDLMKVQDPNVANSLEGKVSGITITPNAGGAGGASKIILRGNKSILGSSTPLIVVDGVPMENSTRGQRGFGGGEGFEYSSISEGSDPLSLINPDDIESMNVLKGANAAALYGSRAANGVIMITTKKGREGKLDINFTSNITFDTPLLTPKFQNIYGASEEATGGISLNSWGPKLTERPDNKLVIDAPMGDRFYDKTHPVHLRNFAHDDVKDFFRTGVTTNNSVSLSGGTELMRSYFSMANSHANGMMRTNSYNRNSFNFRQTFKFFKRLNIDVSLNYAETITRNRPGGGTVGNPLYHLYTAPRNLDMGYYRNNYYVADGRWTSGLQAYYKLDPTTGNFKYTSGQRADLTGPLQNWAFLSKNNNNPYWLLNMNGSKQIENRLFGTITAKVDIYDGLDFQVRMNYNQLRFHSTSRQCATTFSPDNIVDYGRFWDSEAKTTEIYTDYLLSYNKQFGDYVVSATAGFVGHTIKSTNKGTSIEQATYLDPLMRKLPTKVNYFETNAGDRGVTTTSKSSNWDRAWLFTAQLGWKDMVYIDGSFRRDWYRPYRIFKQKGAISKDYFDFYGVGANAIVSSMVKLPKWFSYLKYRISYSEAGNSIPNNAYSAIRTNLQSGAAAGSGYVGEFHPGPEKTGSFETGIETLFFGERLSFDFTYYNATVRDLFMTAGTSSGLTALYNSARVRNQGFEATIGYDFYPVRKLRWRTSYNMSFNNNKILETAFDKQGKEMLIQQNVAGARVRYKRGGSVGDMYVSDFQRNADGTIAVANDGSPKLDNSGKNDIFVGNMNSKWQMGWSNTFTYKNFNLFFLINGRIGGKVISLTESYLDYYGVSKRSGDARSRAEANNIVAKDYGNQPGIELPDGSGRIVPIDKYYKVLGGSSNPLNYVYNATNFRLRELSLGYTFRDLLGMNHNLSVSFIARNLFFLYKDCPTDPDVSLSTGNGLGGFELFNMPSSRSYGLSLKVNF